jgi:predicted PurR-regulated permease PerM
MTASRSAPASIAVPLWILALIAIAFFLRATRELFVPIAIAALISYALYPVVTWLEQHRVPHVAAVSLLVGGLPAVTLWGASTLGDDIRRAAEQLPHQLRQVQQQLRSGTGNTVQRLQEAAREAQKMGVLASGQSASGGQSGGSGQEQPPGQGASSGGPGSPSGQGAASSGAPSALSDYLWQGSMSLVSLAGHLTVITFLVFFLLLSARAWRERLIAISGDVLSSRRTGAEVLDDITWQVQRFLLVRLVTAVVVGTATWLALMALGAPNAALWGLLAGVLNSIPFFGPLIVSGGLFVVGLVSGGLTAGLKYGGVALVITSLEGWLISPPLMGRAAQMNTLAVFVGLLVWSWVWGIWGTLLAVPMLMLIKAVCDHVERLEPVAKLLDE